MRRAAVTAAILLAAAACGPAPAVTAHGRQGSWRRVEEPAFAAGPAYSINGLVAPGDGYPMWTAAGTIREASTAPAHAVAWSSLDGTRWGYTDLDQAGA